MSKSITALLFGAGARGADSYAPYALAHPDEIRFIGVAEPDGKRRERFANAHGIPAERCYGTWEDALKEPKFADVVINCTQDQMHYSSSLPALEMGYDMLLEKPICNTLAQTVHLVQTAEEHGRVLQICHVLRYTDFFQEIKKIIQSGRLGQIIHISHRENVASFHMAHSFVRGHWCIERLSSPMILAKCCHDLDLLFWLTERRPVSLSSIGGLRHYTPENAPAGAPQRCTDGCPVEDTCPYHAPTIYIDIPDIVHAIRQSANPLYRLAGYLFQNQRTLLRSLSAVVPDLRQLTEYQVWPSRTISNERPLTEEILMQALREGPYGRCVYYCDNDVVDNQVVSIEFEDGLSATLTMQGHAHEEGRTIRIDGSHATLLAKFSLAQNWIEIRDHRGFRTERLTFPGAADESSGHGGGDRGLMQDFIRSIHTHQPALSHARDSLESHLMAFAAEESRHNQTVVHMPQFRALAENAPTKAL